MFRAADGRAMFAIFLMASLPMSREVQPRRGCPSFSEFFLVTSKVPGPGGTYWLGTRDRGLFHLSDGTISAAREILTDRKINALLSAGDKQLWIGTDTGCCCGMVPTSFGGFCSSLRDRQILSLSRDGKRQHLGRDDQGVSSGSRI